MTVDSLIRDDIRNILGEDGLAKANIVASRAAILKNFDSHIDMTALIIGLYVGNDGDMPDTLPMGVIGLIQTLAIRQVNSLSDPQPHP